jgi:D-beta-D-heptose 7-phosphate kinase/D-beta-D-heptose 1-phosphate adenosyltransferase
LLHTEHKKFLKAAKKLGGKLIVGLEQDRRVSQLKGPDRPVNKLETRITNLQKLNIADEVIALPEKFYNRNDFSDFIESLHPDILAVSASTPFLEVKKKILKHWGGKVVVVLPHNPRVSTTKMLRSRKK